MTKPPSLFNSVRDFLGPIMAQYARLIEDGDPDRDITVDIGYGVPVVLKLKHLKDLDRAYAAEFRRREARDDNRAKRDDLVARMNGGRAE